MKPCSNKDIQPGIHEIPFDEYLADPCPEPSFSSDVANAIVNRSPRHAWYRHPRLNPVRPKKQSAVMDIGKIAHLCFLERVVDVGMDSRIVVIDAKDYRTKDAKAQRDEAYQNGLVPVLEKQHELILCIGAASQHAWDACSELQGLFDDWKTERSVLWTEDQAGTLWCRSRPDLISDNHTIIVNYKITGMSAEPDEFGSGYLIRGGYHVQAYNHCRGIEQLTGVQTKYIWMVQEDYPPYDCSFIGMSPSLRALAEAQWEHAFAIWQECLESGKWPGYPNRVCWVDAPGWQLKKWEERPEALDTDATFDAMKRIGDFVT